MNVEYLKAGERDFEEVVDLCNLVFSAYAPHSFELMLPAQYLRRNFMSGTNYIVKEDDKIVANVGAYPVDYRICENDLKISAITCVAVHPRMRLRGYMKKLMEMALDDMREDGVDLSFLYGARQRYEYFGFTPCGTRYEYHCDKHNISHFLGKSQKPDISLKEIDVKDTGSVDAVFDMYNKSKVSIIRPRERFADILIAWENKTFGIYKDDLLIGYLSTDKNYGSICELYLSDIDLIGNVVGIFLEQFNRYDVSITAFPFETELNTALSKFTGSAALHGDGNYYAINYPNVLKSFIELKCENTKIPDGTINVGIRDIGNITVSVSNNRPSVRITGEKPDIEVTHLEAMRLFFSPFSAHPVTPLEGNTFARCLFPIPLFIRRLDRS